MIPYNTAKEMMDEVVESIPKWLDFQKLSFPNTEPFTRLPHERLTTLYIAVVRAVEDALYREDDEGRNFGDHALAILRDRGIVGPITIGEPSEPHKVEPVWTWTDPANPIRRHEVSHIFRDLGLSPVSLGRIIGHPAGHYARALMDPATDRDLQAPVSLGVLSALHCYLYRGWCSGDARRAEQFENLTMTLVDRVTMQPSTTPPKFKAGDEVWGWCDVPETQGNPCKAQKRRCVVVESYPPNMHNAREIWNYTIRPVGTPNSGDEKGQAEASLETWAPGSHVGDPDYRQERT